MIVIRSLVPGGVAEQDGRLKPVDRLMSVNDTNLEHSSLSFAVETLKGTPKGEFLTLSFPRVLSSKPRGKNRISFCKIVKNKKNT